MRSKWTTLLLLASCQVSDVSRSGKAPSISAVTDDSGFSAAPRFCTAEGGRLRIEGSGFAPLPSDILSDDPGVTLPTVRLEGPDDTTLTGVRFDPKTGDLTATVPAGVAAGTYDLVVVNPNGESDTLANAVEISSTCLNIELCDFVDPAFGWVNARTTIELCASNANGNGLLPTPEVFILIGDDEVPLTREAFLSPGTTTDPSLASAVVPSQADDARIVAGGPYDIRVVNPGGNEGLISGAFRVLVDPPPSIDTVSPALGDTSSAALVVTITGQNFKASPNVSVALVSETGTEVPCASPAVTGSTSITCTLDLSGAATGGYIVRVRHEDDGAFDVFSAFAVTQPSRKLGQNPAAQPSLSTARRAHGVVLGSDDLGNRFVYAIGGENGTTAALADGEVAALSNFGVLGNFTALPNLLPEGRTGVALAIVDRFVYAIGGSSDGATPITTNAVLRARILGSDTAPTLAEPIVGAGGTLTPGTYYYRVAAIMTAAGDNASGETLASDEVPVRVSSAGGSIVLNWTVANPSLVDHFIVYRSVSADDLSGSEVLLHETASNTLTYTDTGATPPDTSATAKRPLPVGSLGVWLPVADTAAAFIERFDASATVVRLDATLVFLYVAGGRDAGGALQSTQWAALAADGGSTGGLTWQGGPDLSVARAEHALLPMFDAVAASVPTGTYYLVAAGGSSGDRLQGGQAQTTIEASLLATSSGQEGTPGTWVAAGSMGGSPVGFTAVIANDNLYEFNGWAGSGGSFPTDSWLQPACLPSCPSFDSGSSATVGFGGFDALNYRAGMAFFGAYFYFVGGSSGTAISTTSNLAVRATY